MTTRTKVPPWRVTLFWLGAIVFVLLAIHLLGGVLLPFVAGIGIAYLLNPLVDRLARWRVPRVASAAIVLLVFFLILAIIIMLLLPLIESQVSQLATRAPQALDDGRQHLQQWMDRLQERLSPEDAARLREMAGSWAAAALGWGAKLVEGMLASGVALASLLSLIFITPLVAFYLLCDWHNFTAHIDSWVPRHYAVTVREQLGHINEMLAGFLRGQLLICVIMAVYYAVALTIIGTSSAVVIGILIGILAFIPVVGALIGFLLAIGLTLVQEPTWQAAIAVVVVFAAGQGVESNVLSPKLVGDRVHLHPVWIIFALLAFGKLFGFLGVLLALPAAAVVGVLVRFAMGRYLDSPIYDPDHARRKKRRG